MLTFEDFPLGRTLQMAPRQVSQEEIIAFAEKYDPQPFHTDPDSPMAASVGGLIASGWHTCGLMMRMICDSYLLDSASMGAPGLDWVRWLKPVRPGDTLTGTTSVTGRRVSASRPELGLLTFDYELRNQHDEAVMQTHGTGMMRVAEPGKAVEAEGEAPGRKATEAKSGAVTSAAEEPNGHTGESFYHRLQPGMQQEIGSYTFTEEEVVDFAGQFDPQPFHLSHEAAEKSHFGALCASGWHTMAAWMRLNVEHAYEGLRETAGYTGGPPKLGPSPGVRNIRWPHPVYVGDTIRFRSTVTGKRPGKTDGWGLMTFHSEGFNEDGVKVMSMDGAARMPVNG